MYSFLLTNPASRIKKNVKLISINFTRLIILSSVWNTLFETPYMETTLIIFLI